MVNIKLTVTQFHDYSKGTDRNTMFNKLTLFTNQVFFCKGHNEFIDRPIICQILQ